MCFGVDFEGLGPSNPSGHFICNAYHESVKCDYKILGDPYSGYSKYCYYSSVILSDQFSIAPSTRPSTNANYAGAIANAGFENGFAFWSTVGSTSIVTTG